MRLPPILGTVGCFLLSAVLGCEGDTKPTVNPNPIKADPKANDLTSAPRGGGSNTAAAKRAAARKRSLSDKNQIEQ